MDIYSFLNSRDETEYLQDIGYEFTAREMAYIICQSNYASVTRKMVALDSLAHEAVNRGAETDFAEFLRDYIWQQQNLLYRFFDEGGAVYQYATYQNVYDPGDGRRGIWKFVENPQCFRDFEGCYHAWFDEYKKYGMVCPGAQPPRIRFLKRGIHVTERQKSPCIWIEVELQDKVIAVQERNVLTGEEKRRNEAFQDMHFSFPVPFHRGDILYNNWVGYGGYKRGPFVLDQIEGDQYRAVYLDEYETGMHLFKGTDGPALNLERYKEPLKGPQKGLKAVSTLMSGEVKDRRQFDPALWCRAYALNLEEQHGD